MANYYETSNKHKFFSNAIIKQIYIKYIDQWSSHALIRSEYLLSAWMGLEL